jgi:hypothetical protein
LPESPLQVPTEPGYIGATPKLIQVPTEPGYIGATPKIVNTSVPLRKQGWSGDNPVGPRDTSGRRSADGREVGDPQRRLPPQPATRTRRASGSEIYENVNPSAAIRPAAVQAPHPIAKSILKKTADPSKIKKSVQYTPSTKKARPVVPKRPPTPDLEISIRPTSTLDIFDEIIAGQPTKKKGGQTIPDTLIQITEPTPHDQPKKSKKSIPTTDRVLREKKTTKK